MCRQTAYISGSSLNHENNRNGNSNSNINPNSNSNNSNGNGNGNRNGNVETESLYCLPPLRLETYSLSCKDSLMIYKKMKCSSTSSTSSSSSSITTNENSNTINGTIDFLSTSQFDIDFNNSDSDSDSASASASASSSPSSSFSLFTSLSHASSSLSPKIKITSLPPLSNVVNSNDKEFTPSMRDILKHTHTHIHTTQQQQQQQQQQPKSKQQSIIYTKSNIYYEQNSNENRYKRMRSLHTPKESIITTSLSSSNDCCISSIPSSNNGIFDSLENLAQVALEQQLLNETKNKNILNHQNITEKKERENEMKRRTSEHLSYDNINEHHHYGSENHITDEKMYKENSMKNIMSNIRKQNVSRKCKVYDCIKSVASKGLCASHGGGKRCSFMDCERIAVSRGLCRRHGGGKRCDVPTCMKGTQSNSNYCWAHGGGKRCEVPYCMSSTKTYGLCAAHLRLLYVKYQPELVEIMNRNVKKQRVRGGCIK